MPTGCVFSCSCLPAARSCSAYSAENTEPIGQIAGVAFLVFGGYLTPTGIEQFSGFLWGMLWIFLMSGINNAATFRPGFVTPDDRWDNYWRSGRNALLGWDGGLPGHGSGAKSMGRELAGSERFASCQVEKVFRNVCFRPPSDAEDRARVAAMTASFRNNGYRLKQVFADAATYCMGE